MTMTIREDLPFMLNQMGLTGNGVEVGVLRGEFASHILKYWKGKKLYCVDAWRHISGNIDINNPDHNGHLDNMAKTFMALYGFQDRATLIREVSSEAAKLFGNRSLSFVFIDAAHDYENVKKDLEAWHSKVQWGGVFCGHDYLDESAQANGHSEFGVKKAVDEFAAKHGYVVQSTPESWPSWWVVLPSMDPEALKSEENEK
jgi:hypothetical protein